MNHSPTVKCLHVIHESHRKYAIHQLPHSIGLGHIWCYGLLMVKGNNDVSKGLFVSPENMAMGLVFVQTNGNKNNKKSKSESKESQRNQLNKYYQKTNIWLVDLCFHPKSRIMGLFYILIIVCPPPPPFFFFKKKNSLI